MKMLKQIFICIYFLVIISGCNQSNENIIQIQEKEESDVLEFHNNDSLKKNVEGFIPIPFYGHHNFLLANHDTIYYYTIGFGYSICGTGIDYSKPEFLNLNPAILKPLNYKILDSFLMAKVKKTDDDFIVISAPNNKKNILQQKF